VCASVCVCACDHVSLRVSKQVRDRESERERESARERVSEQERGERE